MTRILSHTKSPALLAFLVAYSTDLFQKYSIR